MNEHPEIDAEQAACITRNNHLAFAMLRELIENPALIEQLPNKATVFVAPPDDPEHAAHQMKNRARTFAENGYRSVVWRLGADDDPRAIPVSATTHDPTNATGAGAA